MREAGRAMAKADLELVPIVDENGALTGVLTERALARRYVRDSLRTSTLEEAPTYLSAVVSVLEGELVCGEERQLSGRVWVYAMDPASRSGISDGDIVVVGNRPDAQSRVIELGAALVVLSNSAQPAPEALSAARERGTAIVVSPLDSYVAGRMITLAAPCSALMESDPLTVNTDFLVDDISEQIKESHYGAAVAVDADNRPVGLVTRSDLVAPARRRVVLVDHAEQAQSAVGHRRGRDPGDPRPPPHRLDRDADPGDRHLRPGRLDGHARRRALPPRRHGAQPADGDDAARRRALGHGHPQLGHHDPARPRRGRVPGAGAGRRRRRAGPGDVRGDLRRLWPERRGDRHP